MTIPQKRFAVCVNELAHRFRWRSCELGVKLRGAMDRAYDGTLVVSSILDPAASLNRGDGSFDLSTIRPFVSRGRWLRLRETGVTTVRNSYLKAHSCNDLMGSH